MFLLNSFGWTGGGGGAPVTPVTGSGTPTYLPIWTGVTILGDSIVRQNASNTAVLIGSVAVFDNSTTKVGIGLSAGMSATLHVRGIGSTSATSAFYVDNSSSALLFQIKDDGQVSSTYGYWQGANKILYINPNSTTANLFIGQDSGNTTMTGIGNVGAGFEALKSLTTGSQNVAVGNIALKLATEANTCVAVGSNALSSNITGSSNNAFGANSLLSNSTGVFNNAFGYQSLVNNTTGSFNSVFGHSAMVGNNTGSLNVAVGYAAMDSCGAAVNHNTGIGTYALRYVQSSYNVAVGYNSLGNITTGHTNIAIGYRAGELIAGDVNPNQTSDTSIYIGYLTKPSANGNTNEIVIGYNVTGNGSNTITLGNTSVTATILRPNVGIGLSSGMSATLHVRGIGSTSATSAFYVDNSSSALLFQIKDDGQVSSTYGYWQGANKILYINPNGIIQSVFVGESSGNGTVTGSQNTGVGSQTLISVTSGSQNTAVGWASLILNTTGYINTAIGTGALYANTSGWGNMAVGVEALRFNTTGFENTAIGYKSSYSVTTGVGNTTIGTQSLYLTTTASYNVAIGYQAGYYNTTASDQLYIHNGRGVTNYATGLTNSLIYGIFALTPDAQYYTVNANVKITQGLTETKITDVATGTHTVLSSEYIFNCTGDCTINLPATTATNVGIGKVYRIFAGEAVTVTITPDGADTIDGAASATVIGWGMITLRVLSNGNWRVGD